MSTSNLDTKFFARVIPNNIAAKVAFSSVWDTLDGESAQYTHNRQYITREPQQLPLDIEDSSDSTTVSSTAGEASTEEVDRTISQYSQRVWSGYYLLNVDGPKHPGVGWRAGCGQDWEKTVGGNVDLLLAMSRLGGLHSIHVNFNFNKSGIFVVKALHRKGILKVNGFDIATMKEGYALAGHSRFEITIGELDYVFQYPHLSTSKEKMQHKKLVDTYFEAHTLWSAPHESMFSTMTDKAMNIGDWTIHSVLGMTRHTMVRAATNRRGGHTIAVKLIVHTSEDRDRTSREISTYQRITQDVKGARGAANIMTLHSFLYEEDPDYVGCQTVYLFWNPLAKHDFSSLQQGQFPRDRKGDIQIMQLFQQALQGLAALHSLGWVHRDIKPANIGYTSLDPPHAVILDLEQARNLSDFPYQRIGTQIQSCGTVGYHAPEMEEIDGWYNCSVDVWSAGCVGFQLFFGDLPWRRFTNPWRPTADPFEAQIQIEARAEYHNQMALFAREPYGTTANILTLMLEADPRKRVNIERALAYMGEILGLTTMQRGSRRKIGLLPNA